MSARFVLLLAGLLALAPSSAQALEIKNIRPSYGYLGATRTETKLLPGDILFISYDIAGLKIDDKNKVSYVTSLDVFNSANESILPNQPQGNVVIPQLGGASVPGDLHMRMGIDRPPGKYKVRLSVKDVNANEQKSFLYEFELLPKNFGIVAVNAPAIAFTGHPYMLNFNIVEFGLDAKMKPQGKVDMKILDDTGKVVSSATIRNYPADVPEDFDLKKANILPVDFPIFPNRPGRFTVEMIVTDSISQKTATVRYTLNVLDIGAIAASK